MENFILILLLSVCLVYFFSLSMYYKSLIFKSENNKNLYANDNVEVKKQIKKYTNQLKVMEDVINEKENHLKVAREDLRIIKLEMNDLKREKENTEIRFKELESSISYQL